jgi:hypothetical protein
MDKYLLVAVGHDKEAVARGGGGDCVMSRVIAAQFAAEVGPILTDKCLIMVEGLTSPHPLTPGDPAYPLYWSYVFRGTGLSVTPTIGGVDPRIGNTLEEAEEMGRKLKQWCDIVLRLVRSSPEEYAGSETIAERVQLLRERKPSGELIRTPSNTERELARLVGVANRRFDRRYLEEMHKRGRRYERCIFVGGATHVMSMALKSGYPIADLIGSETAWAVHLGYLMHYEWPKLFR